jgi:hypothetical protein
LRIDPDGLLADPRHRAGLLATRTGRDPTAIWAEVIARSYASM